MDGYVWAVGIAIAAFYLLSLTWSFLSTAWQPGLKDIPNAHWTASYSPCWLLWQKYRQNEHTARLVAHRKYGPVIRIAPSEISIDCIEGGIKTVFGNNWDKSDFYTAFAAYGHFPLFATVEGKNHNTRKRMLAQVYTKSYIDNSTDLSNILKVENNDRLLPSLTAAARDAKDIDVLYLAWAYFFDVTTAYLYGLQNATDYINNPTEGERVIDGFTISLGPDTFFLLSLPKLTTLLAKIGVNIVPSKVYGCFPTFLGFGQQASEKTKKSIQNPQTQEKSTSPVVYNHFKKNLLDAKTPEDQIDNLVAAEMLDHLHAAHQASGILVTYLMWELSKKQELQVKLIEELKSLRADGKQPENSELLEVVLLETMRLHPAVFGPFPRIAPLGGGTVGKYEGIPAGTIVSASPYTLGRNPEVFEDPEEWRPERWTEASPDAKKEMLRWIWVFGSGARVCLGRYLAENCEYKSYLPKVTSPAPLRSSANMSEAMKSMIVAVYENFSTHISADIDMVHVEAMMASPREYRVPMHFKSLH